MWSENGVNLKIDMRSGVPIYLQIVDQVKQMLLGGQLKVDDQLPTVRSLAADLRVNFNTVARAYRLLDEAGLISTQQGRGTYILEKPDEEVIKLIRTQTLDELTNRYLEEAIQQGCTRQQIMEMVQSYLNKSIEKTGISSEEN
jgi:GntR family transcriptional regulator